MSIWKDSVAVVTGGASGLGAATARALADTGMKVALFDLNKDAGTALAAELGGMFHSVDVSDPASVTAGLDAVEAQLGTPRVLVNCAGIGPAAKTVSRGEAHDPAVFDKTIRVNLIGTFNCASQVAARMVAAEPTAPDGARGVIINTASVAAYDGQIGQVAYSASKGGIVGMTLPIARDLAVAGIRVNTIAPGLIDTPIYGEGEQSDAFKAHLGQSVLFPMRLGSAEELAYMVMELITNPYMNGEVIRVDGGIRMPPK